LYKFLALSFSVAMSPSLGKRQGRQERWQDKLKGEGQSLDVHNSGGWRKPTGSTLRCGQLRWGTLAVGSRGVGGAHAESSSGKIMEKNWFSKTGRQNTSAESCKAEGTQSNFVCSPWGVLAPGLHF
jgi:hypothetical protein